MYFKVPSQNLQLLWLKPQNSSVLNIHEETIKLWSDRAALQAAVNTPCVLCLAPVPVLLNISQSHSHYHNTQPIAWKTFTKIIWLGLCWAVINLKVRCHIASTEPQKSKDKRKQPQNNPNNSFF